MTGVTSSERTAKGYGGVETGVCVVFVVVHILCAKKEGPDGFNDLRFWIDASLWSIHKFVHKIVEDLGIEPKTSCMLSTRSTNCTGPPRDHTTTRITAVAIHARAEKFVSVLYIIQSKYATLNKCHVCLFLIYILLYCTLSTSKCFVLYSPI